MGDKPQSLKGRDSALQGRKFLVFWQGIVSGHGFSRAEMDGKE
jgi:hypothetical protein